MKTTSCVFTILLILLMTVVPCLAGEPDAKAIAEVKAVLEKHGTAFAAKNLDVVTGMYSKDAILIGTTPMQRWVGAEEIKMAHKEFFKTFDQETIDITWVKIRTHSDMAVFAADLAVSYAYRGVRAEFPIVWTGTLAKRNGKWVFVLAHFSSQTFGSEYGGRSKQGYY